MTLRIRSFSEVVVLCYSIVDIDTMCADWFAHRNGIEASEFIFLRDMQLS